MCVVVELLVADDMQAVRDGANAGAGATPPKELVDALMLHMERLARMSRMLQEG